MRKRKTANQLIFHLLFSCLLILPLSAFAAEGLSPEECSFLDKIEEELDEAAVLGADFGRDPDEEDGACCDREKRRPAYAGPDADPKFCKIRICKPTSKVICSRYAREPGEIGTIKRPKADCDILREEEIIERS